jgi:hypothetical protein
VPTLTEVVEPVHRPLQPEPEHDPNVDSPYVPAVTRTRHDDPPAGGGEAHGLDEGALIERVLADLQRQVELMLEYRLREVLTPALTRATEALMRDARVELASTLRDVVARAVAQELSRHRGR